MSESQSSYRQIFKATSLFGGVQLLNIIIGVIRVKFVAVLLGTTGVGLIGLLNSPLQVIATITGFGIAFSAVRDISEAHSQNDQKGISRTVTILRRWSWFAGVLGAFATISLAPMLSKWTFGNNEYNWAFVWLSVTLLLQAITKSQSALLQGTRRLKELAKAGVIGSILGLFTSLPLYYWLGVKGIVPALIITVITSLILSWYYSHRIYMDKVELTYKETFKSGLGMVKLGIFMTLAGFIASLSAYVLNAFISNRGGIEQVGLYNAGWGIVGQYTGIVFTAMATDYFPRLSAVQSHDDKVKELVNQQAITALLIMTPLLALLIVTMPLVIKILYTTAFLPIVMFANFTVLGMQFKAVSWAMGYVFLAKGDGRLFLTMEVISGTVILFLNLLFYYFFQLNGLGVSFAVTYLLGMLFAYLVLRIKYNFSFPKEFFIKLIITYGFVVLSFLTAFISINIYRYLAGSIILIMASFYSLKKLNDLMDVRTYLCSRLKKITARF